MRPSWHEIRLGMAEKIAMRSLCVRDKVGAIIIDSHGRIIAEGYNGPPSGFPHHNKDCNHWCARGREESRAPGYIDCPALHAEANALIMADRIKCMGGTIFVTSHVCFSCAKLIANARLYEVVVSSTTQMSLERDAEKSYAFLIECGLTVIQYDKDRKMSFQ
jgi:dCMP deaminase